MVVLWCGYFLRMVRLGQWFIAGEINDKNALFWKSKSPITLTQVSPRHKWTVSTRRNKKTYTTSETRPVGRGEIIQYGYDAGDGELYTGFRIHLRGYLSIARN